MDRSTEVRTTKSLKLEETFRICTVQFIHLVVERWPWETKWLTQDLAAHQGQERKQLGYPVRLPYPHFAAPAPYSFNSNLWKSLKQFCLGSGSARNSSLSNSFFPYSGYYCCVTNHPQHLVAANINSMHLAPVVSVGEEHGHGLAGLGAGLSCSCRQAVVTAGQASPPPLPRLPLHGLCMVSPAAGVWAASQHGGLRAVGLLTLKVKSSKASI